MSPITVTKRSGSKPPTFKITVPISPPPIRPVSPAKGTNNPPHFHVRIPEPKPPQGGKP